MLSQYFLGITFLFDLIIIISMLQPIASFLVGLLMLVYGSKKLLDASAKLALYYGISAFFIGVTVISVGTSIPEMAISVTSSLSNHAGILTGNIIGSEVAQITLGLGIVALISPLLSDRKNILRYGGFMVIAMVLFLVSIQSGVVTRAVGFLLIFSYVFFLYHIYSTEGGKEVAEVEKKEGPKKTVPWIVLGMVLVLVGPNLMVSGGTEIANIFGVPEFLIGLLSGLGTTLPEIMIASMAALQHNHGISVGSLLGSNITDPVFSFGLGPAIAGNISIPTIGSTMLSGLYMLAVSSVIIAMFAWKEGVNRKMGVLCILLYIPALFIV